MPSKPPSAACLADVANAAMTSAIIASSMGTPGSLYDDSPEGEYTGSFDQEPSFTAPLCASWMNASAPWWCTASVTARKPSTASGVHAAALLVIWYALVGWTCAWPAMTTPAPPAARSAR